MVSPGKFEIGARHRHCAGTKLPQINWSRISDRPVQMVRASTATSPDEGVTSGSLSIQPIRPCAGGMPAADVPAHLSSRSIGSAWVAIDRLHRRWPSPAPAMSGPAIGIGRDISLDRAINTGLHAKYIRTARAGWKFGAAIDIPPDKIFARVLAFIHDIALPANAANGSCCGGDLRREARRAEGDGAPCHRGPRHASAQRNAALPAGLRTEHGAEAALRALRRARRVCAAKPA